MYNTYKFRDATAKHEGVVSNTVDMVFAYFWVEAAARTTTRHKLGGMTLEEIHMTKAIIKEWVDLHPDATITELSDFASSLVSDYTENRADIAADAQWEE